MSSFMQDVRFALRVLAKSRSFTIVAILTLAIGIGATSAMFSVVSGVLLRPFAFEDPDRIVMLYETLPQGGTGSVSVPNFIDWRAQNSSFDQMAAYTYVSVNLQRDKDAERLRALAATSNYFDVFKIKPLLGRYFAPGEDSEGHDHVLVLSEAIWRSHFGADPSVIGRVVPVEGEPFTIIGVAPAMSQVGRYIFSRTASQVYVPLTFTQRQLESRGSHMMLVAGRLKPNVTLEQAREEMKVIASRLEKQYPDIQNKRSILVRPLGEDTTGLIKPALLVLFGAVLFVLVIACINVTNLMLARAAVRRKEIAIRTALGAGVGRLIRQFLTESLLIAIAGALLGLYLAQIALKVLVTMAAAYLPRANEITLDWRVFCFTLVAAVGCAVAVGLAPALQLGKSDVQNQLKETGNATANPRMNRVRSMLAVGEISTAVVLLIGAGLLLASLYRLNKVQPGFDPTNVLTFKINLTQSSYDTLEKTQQFYDELQRRLMSIPGVKSAGMISVMPVEQYGVNGPVEIVGLPYNAQYQSPTVEMRSVSTNYFQTLGIPVVSGRDIAPSDNAQSQKVVVVNEAFQRVFFGGESALGRIIGPNAKEGYIIVGVVKDIHQSGLVRDPMPEAYYPYAQDQDNRAAVVVKTSGDPLSIVSQVREQVRSIDARQAIFDPDNFENVISRSLSNNKLNATLMSVFAGIATILAAIGIFGVMSYLVTQHTREIGIRMALGAQRSDVLRMVVGQGMVLTLIALGIGSVLSLMTSRALTSLLFGVKPLHLGVYAAVEVGLLLVAAFSCLFPAMRATRVDPMVALRQAE